MRQPIHFSSKPFATHTISPSQSFVWLSSLTQLSFLMDSSAKYTCFSLFIISQSMNPFYHVFTLHIYDTARLISSFRYRLLIMKQWLGHCVFPYCSLFGQTLSNEFQMTAKSTTNMGSNQKRRWRTMLVHKNDLIHNLERRAIVYFV